MHKGLNIAFAGTPDLAAQILQTIINNNHHHNIRQIYTLPDRPAGRGKKITTSPVKDLAILHKIPLAQPETNVEFAATNELNNVDVLVVAAFGLILSKDILYKPRYGCLNIHTSLLPRWRGAAPIQHAILEGDNETGISIMQMDTGLDTGDILYQESCPIDINDTSGSLHNKLAILGGKCILHVLNSIIENRLIRTKQDNGLSTYAAKIHKQNACINWSKPGVEIHRLIRAMNPKPIAYFEYNNNIIRVWDAEILNIQHNNSPFGKIINYSANGLDIATADNCIRILKLQMPGKKVLTCKEFYNGNPKYFSSRVDD